MRVRRLVAIGLSESILSSAASFVVGLYATRTLSLDALGAYGLLFFGLLLLVSGTSTQLYFTPAEVAVLQCSPAEQMRVLLKSVRRGLVLAAVASALVGGVLRLVLGSDLPTGMLITGVVMGTLSPNQDHVRRILHQAGRSPAALTVSTVQLAVATGAIAVGVATDTPVAWIPLGALALANLASMGMGLAVAVHASRGVDARPPAIRALVGQGRWLVAAYGVEQIGGFAALLVLELISGTGALGEYEAARLLAQPMMVASFGLMTVLRPRAMLAAVEQDEATAVRVTNLYLAIVAALAAAYALSTGVDSVINPLPEIFPNAYALAGMVPLMIAAVAVQNATAMFSMQVVATRRERDLVRLYVPNAPILPIVVAVLAPSIGAYSVPIAFIVERAVWFVRYRPIHRRMFLHAEPVAPAGTPAPATHALFDRPTATR